MSPSRTFRFYHQGTHRQELQDIIDRQAACGKPVDLAWLVNARQLSDSIPIEWVELDSAQDLVLLMHCEQPEHPSSVGMKIYPVQLANATNSHGATRAHPQARKAEILVEWDEGDWPVEEGLDVEVNMYLCGDHFALLVDYTHNPRVIICNWKTGKTIAEVDSKEIHNDATSSKYVRPPLCARHFVWLAPHVFMIGSVQQSWHWTPWKDSLYVYQLSGNSEEPLSHSIMLELPRWKSHLHDLADDNRRLELMTGSWSNDIYPKALSDNLYRRVTVVKDDCVYDGSRYSVFYALQNDVLLGLLVRENGKVLRWEEWSGRCARAFQGVSCIDRSKDMDIQVCGQKVMMVTSDRTRQSTIHVEVADFGRETLDPRMIPGTIVANGARVAESSNSMFELGCVWTILPYRSIPIPWSIDRDTKFILGPDRILYTRRTDGWRKAGYITVQVTYPPQITQGSAAEYR